MVTKEGIDCKVQISCVVMHVHSSECAGRLSEKDMGIEEKKKGPWASIIIKLKLC